jgi:tryptophan synthase alpha chain
VNRIDQLFRDKQERVLSVYMTAGYPALDDTVETLLALQESGVDMVELGMPFSDPLADGEVIQQSSHVALENGMTIEYLFSQIGQVRDQIHIPLVLMGYLNPVLQFGFERFVKRCVETGIDGLILPDLPLEIYNGEYRKILEESGLKFIMLVTPYTTEDRIREIASASGGFLYMVADSSTTGAKKGITEKQLEYFQRIKLMNLSIPRLIGFGISSAETFSLVSEYAHGAIIGSAFIKAVGASGNESVREKTSKFVKSILLAFPG